MTTAFILIAGSLAAGALVLLLWPLLRRRGDGQPASTLAAATVLCAILLGGAGLYAAFSKYTWDASAPESADTPAAMTAKLAKRLASQPDDLEGWLMLGRSYLTLEQYPLAVRAYQRADRLANGSNVEAIIGVGESLVAEDSSALEGAAGKLFERALEIDPNNAKATFYSAFAAMARGDLAKAKQRFQQMLALNPPPEVRQIIETRVAAIDAQLGNTGAASAATAGAGGAAIISVRVTISPELARRVPAGTSLFVAARDPQNPGPPFAAKRLVARFPVDVELTPADAMMPSRHISAGQQLDVVARVALGGTPTATSGDPFGQVSYHVGQDGRLNIVIDRTAP